MRLKTHFHFKTNKGKDIFLRSEETALQRNWAIPFLRAVPVVCAMNELQLIVKNSTKTSTFRLRRLLWFPKVIKLLIKYRTL
jgi:hypothetical protein